MSDLAKIDEQWLRENAKVGVEHVSQADLPTPLVQVVQGGSKNAFLKDGTRAPVGTIYYDGKQEAYPKFPCVFFSAKKDKVYATDGSGNLVDAWVLVGATEGDWKPFLFLCRSTHILHAGAFVGRVVTSGYPMFAKKVVLETKLISGDKGDFYIPVFRDDGIRDNKDELLMLRDLAKKYGDVNVVPEATIDSDSQKVRDFDNTPGAAAQSKSDDVPF